MFSALRNGLRQRMNDALRLRRSGQQLEARARQGSFCWGIGRKRCGETIAFLGVPCAHIDVNDSEE